MSSIRARQIARQRQCRRRAADDERRRHGTPGPGRDQSCQREPTIELAKLRRNVQRRCSAILFGLGERQFVLVDVAERDNPRQHRRVGFQFVEKDFPRHPSGAPGRQIERRLRQSFWMRAGPRSHRQACHRSARRRRYATNGADRGTLKTRMGFLIRGQATSWHGQICSAISNS